MYFAYLKKTFRGQLWKGKQNNNSEEKIERKRNQTFNIDKIAKNI